MLYQIKSNYFCAGLILDKPKGICIKCAPILWKRFFGRYLYEIEVECFLMKWKLDKISKKE